MRYAGLGVLPEFVCLRICVSRDLVTERICVEAIPIKLVYCV